MKTLQKTNTIQVAFTWTEREKIGNIFFATKTIVADPQHLTFDGICDIYLRKNGYNYHNIAYGYLADDFHSCAVMLPVENLKRQVENRKVLYRVNLDDPSLKFFPMVKSKEQMASFDRVVVECGSLD